MKKFAFLVPMAIAILISASMFAQSPEKMSYQAVIRNASDILMTNTQIGMQISILQGSASGTAVYVETQTPTTNANGLVSVEIGVGTLISGDFTAIDWANGPYFIKTETDLAGGTSYSIAGTSQLLSVPYALHAKTAENLSGVNTGDQDISGIAHNQQAIIDTASQIRADIPIVSNFITDESDPLYAGSEAANITEADITKLDSLSGINTGDQDLSTLATKTALGDSTAQIRADIPINNNQLTNGAGYITDYTETDPVFGASVAGGITGTDTTNWNNKQDQLVAGTNISIVGNTISATGEGSSNDFYLGQDTLGGIVVYIYIGSDGNQHGLIVNKNESTAQWQSSSLKTNATRSWDGVYNTGLMTGSPAATYVNSLTDGGFTDWYLPSIDELSILWHNRFHVNNALNVGSFTLLSTSAFYWSSTENGTAGAFGFHFNIGNTTSANKTNTLSVRAVRAF